MIFDSIVNASLYKPLGPRIAAALSFVENVDPFAFRPGEVAIQDRDVFAIYQEYATEPAEGRQYEAHREYVDLQYILSGEETIRVTDLVNLTEAVPYDPERDIAFYQTGPGNDLLLRRENFVILFPQDAHLPKLPGGTTDAVRKVVVKIRL